MEAATAVMPTTAEKPATAGTPLSVGTPAKKCRQQQYQLEKGKQSTSRIQLTAGIQGRQQQKRPGSSRADTVPAVAKITQRSRPPATASLSLDNRSEA